METTNCLDFEKNYKYVSGSGGEKVFVITITPDIATELLKNNNNNRKMKVRAKNRYARDMKNGRWVLNGSSITLDENDQLIDGQNRLTACIESGVSFETILIKHVKTSASKTIDRGNQRSVSDDLCMSGYSDSKILAATAKKVISMELGVSTKSISLSTDEIYEEITRVDRINFYKNCSLFAKKIYKEYKSFSKAYLSTMYVMLRSLGYSESIIDDFFDQLSDKKSACIVIQNLRKRVSKVNGRVIPSKEKFDLLIKTWNEFSKGNYNASITIKNKNEIIILI